MFSAVGSAFVKSSRALVGARTVRTIKVVSGFEVFGFETFSNLVPELRNVPRGILHYLELEANGE